MRGGMRLYVGRRIPFVCRVDRYGVGRDHATLLVTDVCHRDTGEYLSDHIWFRFGHELDVLGPIGGDILTGTAEVVYYIRDSAEGDYGFRHPKGVAIDNNNQKYAKWEKSIQRQRQKERAPKTKAAHNPKVRVKGKTKRKLIDMSAYCED